MFSFLSRTSSASNLISESNNTISTTPIWLPPLNSHLENYVTIKLVEQTPATVAENDSGQARFNVNFKAEVNFVSEKEDSTHKSFPGLSIHETFSIPFSIVTEDEDEDLATPIIALLILRRSSIGYACSEIKVMEKHLEDHEPQTCALYDQNEVCCRIRLFLLATIEKNKNTETKCIAVNLTIQKEVVVSEEELEMMNNWYDDEKSLDPGFKEKYQREIGRARTMEEMDGEYEAIKRSILDEENESLGLQCYL